MITVLIGLRSSVVGCRGVAECGAPFGVGHEL